MFKVKWFDHSTNDYETIAIVHYRNVRNVIRYYLARHDCPAGDYQIWDIAANTQHAAYKRV